MVESRPGRGSDQFPLRLPDGMRDRIKQVAAKNNRSMNAEIVAMLEQGLDQEKGAPAQTGYVSQKDYDRLMQKMEEILGFTEILERVAESELSKLRTGGD